ncbi:TRAP transporter small permease [Devosia ginsengisoli]|uniref:TRAP transporter small permease protein n=1 Tax=Devosia ginsengisoli TaxID=400770 RepID=A0A5B8LYN2_9HYPH|nr:TRAP transporter small permease [Devosia ginsengisoli]QDZ12931.1 TRAP transporter small permease [Devosia ginsengisoli]
MRESLDRLVVRISDGLALVGAIGVVAMLVHITAYVIMRQFSHAPVPATVEIVSYYYMILIAFLPIAWAERRGDMISIEIFAFLMKGRVGRINEIFVALVTAGVYAMLTYTTWLVAMREFSARSFVISLSVAIPVWPSYFVLPVGFGLAAVVTLYRGLMPKQGTAK